MQRDTNIYQDGWNEFNAYVFGLIMSDGCLTTTHNGKNEHIHLGLNDEYMICYIHDKMELKTRVYKQHKQHSLIYRNIDAIEFLKGYGLVERKSLTLRFPKDLPQEFQRHFIRGFFDGDGSLTLHKNQYNCYGQISFACGSHDFLVGLQDALNKLDISSTIYRDRNNYSLKIGKQKCVQKFLFYIYNDIDINNCLKRKFDKYIEYTKQYRQKYVIK